MLPVDDEVFVATKVKFGDPDATLRSMEQCLTRLRRDNVDLLQIHGTGYTDDQIPSILEPGGMLDAMDELKKDGVIRDLGFTSEDNNWGLHELIKSGRFDMMQICYNFIFQYCYEPSRPFGSLYEAEPSRSRCLATVQGS